MDHPGKGRSVWMTLGCILSERDVYAIALHDCDIVNYRREMLARLVYPVAHPALDFEFSKGYYARVTDRLYGRVTRLFYTPMIRTLRRILGFNPFLSYLDNFRYALSGEFAFISSLARGIRISPTWGLEVSLLSEVYQRASINRICQVELAETYEHKHQVLRKEKPNEGLLRMAGDIARALFRVLTQDGIVLSEAFFRTMLTAYIAGSPGHHRKIPRPVRSSTGSPTTATARSRPSSFSSARSARRSPISWRTPLAFRCLLPGSASTPPLRTSRTGSARPSRWTIREGTRYLA